MEGRWQTYGLSLNTRADLIMKSEEVIRVFRIEHESIKDGPYQNRIGGLYGHLEHHNGSKYHTHSESDLCGTIEEADPDGWRHGCPTRSKLKRWFKGVGKVLKFNGFVV